MIKKIFSIVWHQGLMACFMIGLLAISASKAEAFVLIDFNSLSNGEWVTTQFASDGLTISAENFRSGHPDKAITFDSTLTGTDDFDLEDPWSGGNIAGEVLGNLLIIAKNDKDGDSDGFVDSPNDEGRRPAGEVSFLFDRTIASFGFDFVDVDNTRRSENPDTYFLKFYLGTDKVGEVTLGDFQDSSSLFYDASIEHSNNYANRYTPISATDLGSTFDKVVFRYGGSGAIDNIKFAHTPEPATMFLFGSSLMGIFLRRRK